MLIKKIDLIEDIKMLQVFFTLLDFNFIMVFIIHKISVLLKNHLNYLEDSILKRLLRTIIEFYFLKKIILFTTYNDGKFKA